MAMNTGWFPRIAYIHIKRGNKEMSKIDAQKEEVYLPEFYCHDLTYHVGGFIFTLPKGNHLQTFLTPKDNLIIETNPKHL